jgi:sphingomyelin phosphodiesterase acid-like 3
MGSQNQRDGITSRDGQIGAAPLQERWIVSKPFVHGQGAMRTLVARALVIAMAAALPMQSLADQDLALPFEPGPGQGLFLILSDIHFDPFADPAIVHELVEAEVEAWPAILERSEKGFAQYGSDANYPLMRSALRAAAGLLPQPDFVLYAGDHLAHHFATEFDTYGGGGREAYERFVLKTMRFVFEQLQGAFAGTPVYASLGNEDSICGDYMIAPGQRFLAAVGDLWAAHSTHPEAFADFGIGGYYAVPHPTVPDRDLIVLNDVFWSTDYDDRCNPAGGDPGAAQLAWLEWTLYRTRLRGRTASLLFHIPPGIDSFNAAHGAGSCQENVTPYLQETYAKPFLALLEQYRDILQISYAGHTHRDDFRVVVTAAGEPILLTHITPAISPIYQNNPGFAVVLYDRTSGALLDYATVYLTNLAGAGRGEAARWAIEYTFRGAYGYTAYDPATAAELAQAIRTDAAVRDEYVTFVPVATASSDPPIDQQNWLAFACGQTELTTEAFAACYCG